MSKQSLNEIMKNVYKTMEDLSYYNFLAAIVDYLRPKVIVECGTHRGGSCMAMLSTLKIGGHIWTIDNDPRVDKKFPMTHRCVTQIKENGLEVDLDIFPQIDFLFIDSLRTGKHIQIFLDRFLPKVRINGIIAIDDIEINGIPTVWNNLPYPKVELYPHKPFGFGIFIKDK